MGSVKDLQVLKQPTAEAFGLARFVFSDRYSVFDWGEMPDHIPHKGESIALLAAHFFEKLAAQGIPTHYVGIVEDSRARRLGELSGTSSVMEVNLVRVLRPELRGDKYVYSYAGQKGCFLLPLELIYRNVLPPGSSVFKRLASGEIRPEDLGLPGPPVPSQRLGCPILDVSTKLEVTDRYLTWEEAQRMSGLTPKETDELKRLLSRVNQIITQEFSGVGLVNEDGKIEVAFDGERRFLVVDVLGTLDECRFTYEGVPVSKEIARIHYRSTPWYEAVEEAKKKGRHRWKEICRLAPEPLPPRLKELVSQVYCATTNAVTGRTWFSDAPALAKVLAELKRFSQAASALAS